jgi:putative glycosyltransferase (TIGR04372 family)
MLLLFRLCEWIGEITGTIIITPTPYVVGDAAADVYFGLLKARREKKKLIVLFPYELPWRFKFHLINTEIVEVDSVFLQTLSLPINIFGRSIITLHYAIYRAIGIGCRFLFGKKYYRSFLYNVPMVGVMTLFQPKEKMPEFSWEVVDKYKWREQLMETLHVTPSKRVKFLSQKWLHRLGLPKDAWFVCLHVRESGYHNDHTPERNANISNYISAIQEVTNRGGWVVRMGDPSMTRLRNMERVIDYPFTEFKNASMDMYLISECSFYIGMTSGIYDLALLFQKPIILTNMSSWLFGLPPKIDDICLPKHVYSKCRGRFLSVREWLHEPWNSMSYRSLGENYVLHENTSKELSTAVKEYFERDSDWTPTQLQLEFKRLRLANGKAIISKPIFSGVDPQQKYSAEVENPFFPDFELYDTLERYKLASRLDSINGLISSQYLKDNWECDMLDASTK